MNSFKLSNTGQQIVQAPRVGQNGEMERPPVLVLRSGINPVALGAGPPGWVSGQPLGLAANGRGYTVFDLGSDWDQYVVINVGVRPGSTVGLNNVVILGSSDGAANESSLNYLRDDAGGLGTMVFHSVAGNIALSNYRCRPSGRYVVVGYSNADAGNPYPTGGWIGLTAYPA